MNRRDLLRAFAILAPAAKLARFAKPAPLSPDVTMRLLMDELVANHGWKWVSPRSVEKRESGRPLYAFERRGLG